MEIGIIFKIALVGIIITLVCQILKKSDRDDISILVSIVGLIIVMTIVLSMIIELFDKLKNIFNLL